MTNNTDEFDQDSFDPSEPAADHSGASTGSQGGGFMEAWRNKPVFKLIMIMVLVGAALALVFGLLTPDRKPLESEIGKAPTISEVPGGETSPTFIEQNRLANAERTKNALEVGGSAIVTPDGKDVTDLVDKNKKDPLVEFREETERMRQELRNEQQQNAQQVQNMQLQLAQQNARRPQEDETLARAMQKQMESLMESWSPRKATVVKGYGEDKESKKDTGKSADMSALLASQSLDKQAQPISAAEATDKVLIPSGTVNYVQLLTEANSDIPGPILAQILSGPLSGGRAIGRFSVLNDYLVMSFTTVSHKGKEYTISSLALDPDTTLGGLATEVDHRYFSRVLLPAAGAFVSAFGQALSETDATTTVSDGSVLQDKAKKGSKEALYSGLGQAGQTMSQFFQNEANNIKTLVRVAVGTPMGLFFTSPVMASGRGTAATRSSMGTGAYDELNGMSRSSVPYPQQRTGGAYGNSAYGNDSSQAAVYENMMSLMKQNSISSSPATLRRD